MAGEQASTPAAKRASPYLEVDVVIIYNEDMRQGLLGGWVGCRGNQVARRASCVQRGSGQRSLNMIQCSIRRKRIFCQRGTRQGCDIRKGDGDSLERFLAPGYKSLHRVVDFMWPKSVEMISLQFEGVVGVYLRLSDANDIG